MLPSSATAPRTMDRAPMNAMNCQACLTRFCAFSMSAGRAGRIAPPVAAQPAAAEASSVGSDTCGGGCHTGGCCAGATAPVTAHMSQLLLPMGIAQPQVLQTAICRYIGPGRPNFRDGCATKNPPATTGGAFLHTW